METLLKYDGFLPKTDCDAVSTLYRISSTEGGKPSSECVALLIDISGSMAGLMSCLKKAIKSTVKIVLDRKIVSVEQIVLIPFSSSAHSYSNFRSYECLKTFVSQMHVDSFTNYSSAIEELTDWLKQKKQVIAVMFSDGEPTEYKYIIAIKSLRIMARKESLLFHSIGLNVSDRAEQILRNLTTIGSTEGYYQSIDQTEITAAMNVLVDHFNCTAEALINGKRTCRGFIIDKGSKRFVAHIIGKDVTLIDVVDGSFQEMLENDSFQEIVDAFRFLLEYHMKDESLTSARALAIASHISSLLRETENRMKMAQKEKALKLSNEKKDELKAIREEAGASNLKRQSEIISEHNKKVQKMLGEDSELLKNIHELKELSAQIQETLHKNENIAATISGIVMDTVSQFRDNSIALKRKNIARFSSKVREENAKFQNIDKLLEEEMENLVKLESIPVPGYFENYSDPITLNDFQDIILHKYGVFMLLVNVERHEYGITAPHRTKITEVGGFSASVLDVMMKNPDKSIFFDFRGIGFGNAAVPMWISYFHWQKARHVFGPFVGHAVTGNELEYTKLQGMTLLALILIHLRKLEATEYNQNLIQMVGQTLGNIIDKPKWKKISKEMTNSFEKLNESQIPSIEVFLVFQEFVGSRFSKDKALLLLAEQYRRKNVKRIEENFDKLKFSPEDRCNLLIRLFPKIFEKYLNVATCDISMSLNKRSMEIYFTNLYSGSRRKKAKLLKWFDSFVEKLGPSLTILATGLNQKQKIALILSVHKCVCFKWEAVDEIPAGLSCDSEYTDLLLGWCRKKVNEKEEKLRAQCNEELLLKLFQTSDQAEAKTLSRQIKRNSHSWAVMLKVLLLSSKIKRPPKLTVEQWEKHRVQLYKKQIESLSIPLHFQLLMFCVFNSFKSEDWVSTKMVWRPTLLLRRRIKTMFPQAPAIE